MEQERDDQVIYLKDLIFAALYRWRQMLAAGLALGLLLGVVGAVSLLDSKPVEPKPVAQALLQAEQEAKTRLEQHMAYRDNSVLMKLDPYCVYSASFELTVDTGYQIQPGSVYQNPDITEPLLNAYKAAISTTVVEKMAQDLGMEAKYLREVLLIERSTGTRSLSVKIKCADATTAEKLLKGLSDSLSQLHTDTAEAVGQHAVKVLGSNVDQMIDLTVAQEQTKNKEQLDTLQKNLKDAQKAVSAAQTQSEGMSVKKAVLLAVLGVFGGALIVACWEWVRHIAGTRVYSRRTLQNWTGLRVLDCVSSAHISNGLDRWLRKLEGRSTDAEHMDIAAAHIANLCGGQKLMVVGGAAGEGRQKLMEALKEAGVQAEDQGSFFHNPQAVKILPDYEVVLLAEQCMISKYPEVTRAAEMVADHGKTLLGCVLLDG